MMQKDKILQLNELIDLFEFNISQYKGKSYDEAKVRVDFIDKFFHLLDWDVYNEQGYSEKYREVVREDRVTIKGKVKAPDYSFRIGGQRKFFVEAKKPAVDIKTEIDPAFQLRRYAYTAKLDLSILTDFEEFAVYDSRLKPNKTDAASTARIFYCTYKEYLHHLQFFYDTFSRPAILKGRFDEYVKTTALKKGTSPVDKEFLKLIETWRDSLAKNLALRNKELSIYELNYAVQVIIDRIIFLRIAEDRQMEDYGRIRQLAETGNPIYPGLVKLFTLAEQKYDSGLFDFQKDRVSTRLQVDDKVLKDIIGGLYYPDSPYEFSVLDVEILGNIYEQFLGKTIRLTAGHQARVEDKPEVKKAGGVYYTPHFIVDYIVEHTVGEKINGKTPAEITPLKILDPACGSGSFLLGAYQVLLDYHLKYYTGVSIKGDDPGSEKQRAILARAIKENRVYQTGEKEYQLTIEEKQRILLNNIFGVDIDRQAVEVTRLSLLLKLLEGESGESTGKLFKYSDMKLLPDLSENIKCGNSLIGSDFYEKGQLALFQDEETVRRINVFDWEKEFAGVFKQGGFDVVIGNPPYIRIHNLVEFFPNEIKYIQENMKSASFGKVDIYVAFIEKSYSLINSNGLLGFIIPNKFMNSDYGVGLRELLYHNKSIIKIVDFCYSQVFENATIYTCLLFLSGHSQNSFQAMFNTKNLEPKLFISSGRFEKLPSSLITKSAWALAISKETNILQKIEKLGTPLTSFVEKIITGVKTGANDVFIFTNINNYNQKISTLEKNSELIELESELLFPYWKAESMKRYYQLPANRLLIYPYELIENKTTLIPESKIILSYPLIWKYLNENKSILEGRQKGMLKGQHWYGLSFSSDLSMFKSKKIITPTLAPQNSFSLDFGGNLFPQGAGGGCGIVLNKEISAEYILGILNSKLITFYFKRISSRFQGGWFAYEPRYLKRIPILNIDSKKSNEKKIYNDIGNIVNQMLELKKKYHSALIDTEKTLFQKQIEILDHQIDQLVYQLYQLTDDEIKIVEKDLAGNR
jgi:adenine-specific DNA-methyltransferase